MVGCLCGMIARTESWVEYMNSNGHIIACDTPILFYLEMLSNMQNKSTLYKKENIWFRNDRIRNPGDFICNYFYFIKLYFLGPT